MIDFKQKALEAHEADEILKKIDDARYDSFDRYHIVTTEVNDLEVAKVIIKRLLDRCENQNK